MFSEVMIMLFINLYAYTSLMYNTVKYVIRINKQINEVPSEHLPI